MMEIDGKTTGESMMREVWLDLENALVFLSAAKKAADDALESVGKQGYAEVNATRVLIDQALGECQELDQSVQKYAETLEERKI